MDARLAATFAKWALGVRRFRAVGSAVPAPRSFKRFASTLTSNFLYTPSGPAPAARR